MSMIGSGPARETLRQPEAAETATSAIPPRNWRRENPGLEVGAKSGFTEANGTSRAPSEKRKLESSHASLGRLPGANQQDHHHRESRRDRTNTEDQRRRCARIAQHANVF